MKKRHLVDCFVKTSVRRRVQIFAKKVQAATKKTAYYAKADELIAPSQKDLWCQWVDESVSCFYYGQDFEIAIKIMETLKNGGNVKDAKKILVGAHLPMDVFSGALSILATFGKEGPDIYQQLKYEILNERIKNGDESVTENGLN